MPWPLLHNLRTTFDSSHSTPFDKTVSLALLPNSNLAALNPREISYGRLFPPSILNLISSCIFVRKSKYRQRSVHFMAAFFRSSKVHQRSFFLLNKPSNFGECHGKRRPSLFLQVDKHSNTASHAYNLKTKPSIYNSFNSASQAENLKTKMS